VAKATKNKKSEVGRHVGLDFYDLLIEALFDPDGWRAILGERYRLVSTVTPDYTVRSIKYLIGKRGRDNFQRDARDKGG